MLNLHTEFIHWTNISIQTRVIFLKDKLSLNVFSHFPSFFDFDSFYTLLLLLVGPISVSNFTQYCALLIIFIKPCV